MTGSRTAPARPADARLADAPPDPAATPAATGSGRQAFEIARRSFVTGVSVITAGTGAATHGTTVSTVNLASSDPPLVTLALRRRSTGLAILKRERVFAVNTLAADQAALARYFADPYRPRGAGQLPPDLSHRRTAHGIPLLRGAIAWLECRIEQEIPVGDHVLVVARIVAAAQQRGRPLVNFAGVLGPDALPGRAPGPEALPGRAPGPDHRPGPDNNPEEGA